MTLIISAQCNAGICVCADRRYRITEGEQIRFEDNHSKIYSFKNYPLVILNHGVNKFGGKYWDSFCSDFEVAGVWKGKSLEEIARDFEAVINQQVMTELSKGIVDATSTGFLFCGKDSIKGYQIIELRWSHDKNKAECSIKEFPGLTLSGDGKKYIETLVMNKQEYVNLNFWEHIEIGAVRKELKKLFRIANSRKKGANGEEFSDGFDCRCLAA